MTQWSKKEGERGRLERHARGSRETAAERADGMHATATGRVDPRVSAHGGGESASGVPRSHWFECVGDVHGERRVYGYERRGGAERRQTRTALSERGGAAQNHFSILQTQTHDALRHDVIRA